LRWRLLTALLIGAAGVFAFAPFGWFPVNWLSLGALFGLLCAEADGMRSARRGALLAATFAFGLFLAGVSWVYVSLSVFGGMPAWLAGLATLLFCLVLTMFPALAGALYVRFAAAGWLPRVLLFASLWTLAEWLRSWVFSGFPWLAAGYAQVPPSPLAGYAPIVGVYGVTLSAALAGALLGEALRCALRSAEQRRGGQGRRWPALPLLTLALLLGTGALLREVRWTQASGEPLSVALLQGNVAQEIKWRPERFADSLRTYYQPGAGKPSATDDPAGDRPARFSRPDSRRVCRRTAQAGSAPARRAAAGHRRRRGPAIFQCRGESWRDAVTALQQSASGAFRRVRATRLCLVHGHGQYPDVQLHGWRSATAPLATGRPEGGREHLLRGRLRRGDHRRTASGDAPWSTSPMWPGSATRWRRRNTCRLPRCAPWKAAA
jgi:hypothetical protein